MSNAKQNIRDFAYNSQPAHKVFGKVADKLGDEKGMVPVFQFSDADPLRKNIPEPEGDYLYQRDVMRDVLTWNHLSEGEGLYLVGETGVGKSSLVRDICCKLNIPLYSMIGHMHVEWTDLAGGIGLKNGNTVAQTGPLAQAVINGGWFLLDEVDFLHPGVSTALNQILDGRGIYTAAGTFYTVHKHFRMVVTGNTLGEGTSEHYSGAQKLNMAFLDRCFKVRIGYPDPDIEISRVKNIFAGEVDDAIAKAMVKVSTGIRNMYSKGECNVTMSTRSLFNWARYAKAFLKTFKAEGTPADGTYYTLERLLAHADPASKKAIGSYYQKTFGTTV